MKKPARLTQHELQALQFLADCSDEGCTETMLSSHGFHQDFLVQLFHRGFLEFHPRRVRAGRTLITAVHVHLTDIDRRILEEHTLTNGRQLS